MYSVGACYEENQRMLKMLEAICSWALEGESKVVRCEDVKEEGRRRSGLATCTGRTGLMESAARTSLRDSGVQDSAKYLHPHTRSGLH
jgi:hypothetical protein